MAVSRIIDKSKVSLGLAELSLAPYAAHEDQFGAVLGGSDYFGALSEISFAATKSYIKRSGIEGNAIVAIDHLLESANLSISVQFIEITAQSLGIALGGDGTDPDFMAAFLADPTKLRAEMVFTYPNKVNTMTLILPKVQVVSEGVNAGFQSEDMMRVPLTLRALKSDHANWSTRPCGRSVFA